MTYHEAHVRQCHHNIGMYNQNLQQLSEVSFSKDEDGNFTHLANSLLSPETAGFSTGDGEEFDRNCFCIRDAASLYRRRGALLHIPGSAAINDTREQREASLNATSISLDGNRFHDASATAAATAAVGNEVGKKFISPVSFYYTREIN